MTGERERLERELDALKERRAFMEDLPREYCDMRIKALKDRVAGNVGPGPIEPRATREGNRSMYEMLHDAMTDFDEEKKSLPDNPNIPTQARKGGQFAREHRALTDAIQAAEESIEDLDSEG